MHDTEQLKIITTDLSAVSPEDTVTYGEVLTFMNKQPNTILVYKVITTSMDNSIILSGNHVIYARKSNKEKFVPM